LEKIRRKTYNLGIDLDRLDVKVHSEEDSDHGNEVRKEKRGGIEFVIEYIRQFFL
jgi:hypothetical protein